MQNELNPTELVTIPDVNIIEIFSKENGLTPYLDDIRKKAAVLIGDHTAATRDGRQVLVSAAHKVSKSKVYLDNIGKKLTDEWMQKKKLVDNSRKGARDYLDELKNEIREPVNVWEEKDKIRQAAISAAIDKIRTVGKDIDFTTEDLEDRQEQLKNWPMNDFFDEFKINAGHARDKALECVRQALKQRVHYLEQKEAVEKLHREKEETARVQAQVLAKLQKEKEEADKMHAETLAKLATLREKLPEVIKEIVPMVDETVPFEEAEAPVKTTEEMPLTERRIKFLCEYIQFVLHIFNEGKFATMAQISGSADIICYLLYGTNPAEPYTEKEICAFLEQAKLNWVCKNTTERSIPEEFRRMKLIDEDK